MVSYTSISPRKKLHILWDIINGKRNAVFCNLSEQYAAYGDAAYFMTDI